MSHLSFVTKYIPVHEEPLEKVSASVSFASDELLVYEIDKCVALCYCVDGVLFLQEEGFSHIRTQNHSGTHPQYGKVL